MNSVEMNVNSPSYQMTFGNKISKAKKACGSVFLKKMMEEEPEKARIVMRNRMIDSMNEGINKILSPKNLIKNAFYDMTTAAAVGLVKVLGKCDRAINKIPFVKEARVKKLAKFEENIKKRFEDGMIDADQAGVLLTNKKKGQKLV